MTMSTPLQRTRRWLLASAAIPPFVIGTVVLLPKSTQGCPGNGLK